MTSLYTDRQTHIQTHTQTDRQTERHTDSLALSSSDDESIILT